MVFLADLGRGARCRVLAVGARGPAGRTYVPYFAFCETLAQNHAQECALIARLVANTQSFGPPFSAGKAKRLTNTILYELRTRRGSRLFWIYGPQGSVILLNGFQKKSWSIPTREMQRANSWARALACSDAETLVAAATAGRIVETA